MGGDMKTESEIRGAIELLKLVIARAVIGGDDWSRLDSAISTLNWVLGDILFKEGK